MAAPVHTIQVALNWSETAIEKDDYSDCVHFHYSKNSFYKQSKYKNRQGYWTSVWRAAPCAASHKMNGRRSAPPTKWLVKKRKVKLWSIFTTSLELILSKIPEKVHSLRPAAKRRGFAGGSRAKNGGVSGEEIFCPLVYLSVKITKQFPV